MRATQPAIVAPVQSFRTNERFTSQRVLFLCANSNSVSWGFEFGLKQVLKSDRERTDESLANQFGPDIAGTPERLFKIVIPSSARPEILRELHRMNINYATLFPGLDGFARSLNTNVTISEMMYVGGEDVDFPI